MEDKNKMVTLKDFAKEFEPQQMKNIADLEIVKLDTEIKQETRQDQNNEDYHVIYMVIDGIEYRIPPSVVAQIKTLQESKENITSIKVIRTGKGMGTKYQVIPL